MIPQSQWRIPPGSVGVTLEHSASNPLKASNSRARDILHQALVSVSRRPNEVDAFDAAVCRAGLAPAIVHAGTLTAKSEGVKECIVYSFNFAPPCTPSNTTGERTVATESCEHSDEGEGVDV